MVSRVLLPTTVGLLLISSCGGLITRIRQLYRFSRLRHIGLSPVSRSGVGLRYWDLVQVHAGLHSHNSVPLLNLGWWFDIGPVFIDVRISQVFAIASWSNIPYSSPGIAWIFSPLPGISPWMPIGMIQVGVRI